MTRFPVGEDATFEDVMVDLVAAAHRKFVDHVDPVLRGTARVQAAGRSGHYGLDEAYALSRENSHPRFGQATDAGGGEETYTELAAAWAGAE